MNDSLQQFPPGTLMVLGALLLPFLGKHGSAVGALILAILSTLLFWFTPDGLYGNI